VPNPVDDFLAEVKTIKKVAASDLRGRQKREFEMWQQWKQGGMQPRQLRPLVKSFKPLINHQANIFAGRVRDIPPAAIRAEFTNQFANALQTYDPNRGTQLNTHIRHQLKKAQRFVTTYQNPGRIPENRIYKIHEMQTAQQQLDEQFGRPPTALEMADKLKWSPKQVELLQREVRKVTPTGHFESDPTTYTPSRWNEVKRLLPYDLSRDENAVFEHLYGVGGKPQLAPGAIARQLKMSAPKVSRLKKSIAQKVKQYE
jgi:DNA-directed RNA polymerase specialized sigma subunit